MRLILTLFSIVFLISFSSSNSNAQVSMSVNVQENNNELRHVVLFKFNEATTETDIKEIEEAFAALPAKIPEILDFEWGLNNSPEGLDKGFTHCYFITFKDEIARAVYLPHPDHVAFTEIVGPHLDDVLVIDYWTN